MGSGLFGLGPVAESPDQILRLSYSETRESEYCLHYMTQAVAGIPGGAGGLLVMQAR